MWYITSNVLEKEGGFDSESLDGRIVALYNNLLENKCNTPSQHKR